MAQHLSFLLTIGLAAGVLAGLFGVGGGLVIVPALVIFAGYNQTTANGTSLVALLLPIGLAGVWAYYQQGKIDATNIKAGLIIAIAMFFGSYIGAKIALSFPDYILKRIYCVFLVAVAARMWTMSLQK